MPPKRSKRAVRSRRAGMVGRLPAVARPRTVGGFADTELVTLRYVQRFSLTSSTGLDASYFFRGNGPYDPDFTGVGLQPNNYDDFSAQYNRYRVVSSRAKFTAFNPTSNNMPICVFGVAQTVTAVTADSAASQPRNRAKWLTNAGSRPQVWNASASTAAALGLTAAQAQGSDNAASLYNNTPANPWYWRVVINSFDGSTTVTAYCEITIDYHIQWYDRVDNNLDLAGRAALQKAERAAYLAQKVKQQSDDAKMAAAFEDWTEVESKQASFLKSCAKARKVEAKQAGPAAENAGTARASLASLLQTVSDMYVAAGGVPDTRGASGAGVPAAECGPPKLVKPS